MTLALLEAILGKPEKIGQLAVATGPTIDGRVHVDLSEPHVSDQHYAAWLCMLPEDDSIPLGTTEAIGRYCLAVEDENGDWNISASCKLHEAHVWV
jgi:hypothetical protein